MSVTTDFEWISPEHKYTTARGFLKNSPSIICELSGTKSNDNKKKFLRKVLSKIKKTKRIFRKGKYNISNSASISNSLFEYSHEIFKRRHIQDNIYLHTFHWFNNNLTSDSQFTLCSTEDLTTTAI